jgi:hypothetical protein
LPQSKTADTFWTIADAVVKHKKTTADESDKSTKNFAANRKLQLTRRRRSDKLRDSPDREKRTLIFDNLVDKLSVKNQVFS